MPLILVDKPEGPTSHAVVSTIKRVLSAEKVGHLGTLDPFASGLLPILIGNTARLADEAMDGEKGYLFTIGLGTETDTLDPTGRMIAQAPLPEALDHHKIESVLKDFRGEIEQVPPVYSALKMNGMPLYEHMRATGKLPVEIESKRRKIKIHSLSCVDFTPSQITLRVVCSKGTYVRSLARDVAKALHSVGTCIALRREWVEPWHVNSALKLFTDASGRLSPPERSQLTDATLPAWSVAPKLPRGLLKTQESAKFAAGNALEILSGDLDVIENEVLPQAEPGVAQKALVHCEDILFLCEIISLGENRLRVQPRKRIN